ncbi:hypothetical protein NDU88_000898 [Pleurodeles waltl]|uniref:Uncharacterized protein n=1 Tax=Pleurodeles waltl TaxID=8319 RepID=A0AAV7V9E4_PLEWA|nr:hypothetical protein NDU88_000898 [Pleurodeles waltl]
MMVRLRASRAEGKAADDTTESCSGIHLTRHLSRQALHYPGARREAGGLRLGGLLRPQKTDAQTSGSSQCGETDLQEATTIPRSMRSETKIAGAVAM